jgi:hypothetical protein
MLEPTRKPPTDTVELCFLGPAAKRQEAVDYLRGLGFEAKGTDSIPWREAFPEVTEATLPGVCLRGARARESMTQKQLSEKTGIPTRHLSEMENGKRPIGKAMAKRLGEALGVGYKVFL